MEMLHFESSVAAIYQIVPAINQTKQLSPVSLFNCWNDLLRRSSYDETVAIPFNNMIFHDKAYFPSAMYFTSPLYCPNEVLFGDRIAIRIQPPPLPDTSFSNTIEKPV